MNRIVTLTTDFGIKDPYVAAMKAVILSVNPDLRIVDISHDITPHDVMEAAFVLGGPCRLFPPGTVHVVVVDPGVGSSRRAIAVQCDGSFYVAPDNGVLPLLLHDKNPQTTIHLDRSEYWRTKYPSNTFHGRDIFSPVAAHIASGKDLLSMGSPIGPLEPLMWALPITDSSGVQGWVLHIDRFGNCITNINRNILDSVRQKRDMKVYIGSSIVSHFVKSYSNVADGEPALLINSSELLEVAVNGGNAALLFDVKKGDPVNIVFADPK